MSEPTTVDEQPQQIMKPYPINRSSFKVQDTFENDGIDFKMIVQMKRLDSDNFRLLLKKEEETIRQSETLTKNRSKDKLVVDDAHSHFFDSIVIDGQIIPQDEEPIALSYKELTELNIEQKIGFNVKYLDCDAKVLRIVGTNKYDFLFNRDGHILVEFKVGNPDNPIAILLMKSKRPNPGRRSNFRDGFATAITDRGGDLPITRTVINLSEGVRIFDESFDTIINDPNYSQVAFLKDGDQELDHNYVEGNDDDRKLLLKFFNPHFKVEFATELVKKFAKSGRES